MQVSTKINKTGTPFSKVEHRLLHKKLINIYFFVSAVVYFLKIELSPHQSRRAEIQKMYDLSSSRFEELKSDLQRCQVICC